METAYDSNRGWHDGNMSNQDHAVAPYSKIAACYLAGFERPLLRVYAQKTDNTVQEYGTDSMGSVS